MNWKQIAFAILVSTSTPNTVINVFNVGDLSDMTVSTTPVVSVSSCAYIAGDANNCFFECIWTNGEQSKSIWVGHSCPVQK